MYAQCRWRWKALYSAALKTIAMGSVVPVRRVASSLREAGSGSRLWIAYMLLSERYLPRRGQPIGVFRRSRRAAEAAEAEVGNVTSHPRSFKASSQQLILATARGKAQARAGRSDHLGVPVQLSRWRASSGLYPRRRLRSEPWAKVET